MRAKWEEGLTTASREVLKHMMYIIVLIGMHELHGQMHPKKESGIM